METLILVIHIIVAVALIAFILLQSGKGGGVSAAFGGGAGAALGQRSAATVLGKLTVILSITFGVTSMSLAILSTEDKTTSGYEAPSDTKPSNAKTPIAPVENADEKADPTKPSTGKSSETAAPKTDGTKPDSAPTKKAAADTQAPAEKTEKATVAGEGEQNGEPAKPAPAKDPAKAAE